MLAPGKFVRDAAAGSGLDAPLKELTVPASITLVRFPLTVIVTRMVIVQFDEAVRRAPLKENEFAPGVASIVPPHVPTSGFAGSAMIIPAGILSVKPTPFIGTLLGFTNSTL